jgi:hypothetical protein
MARPRSAGGPGDHDQPNLPAAVDPADVNMPDVVADAGMLELGGDSIETGVAPHDKDFLR